MDIRIKDVITYIVTSLGVIAMWVFALAFAVAILASYANAAEIKGSVSKDGSYASIHVYGTITVGDAAEIQERVESAPVKVKYLHLNSEGGVVTEGWEIASIAREHKLETVVNNKCASACTYAFMGGVKRWIKTDTYKMGYHPAHIEQFNGDMGLNEIYDMGQTHAIRTITSYAAYVDSGEEWNLLRFIQRVYNTVSYKEMYWANVDELVEANIVTHTY